MPYHKMIVWLRYDMYRSLFCCVAQGRKILANDEKSVFLKGCHKMVALQRYNGYVCCDGKRMWLIK